MCNYFYTEMQSKMKQSVNNLKKKKYKKPKQYENKIGTCTLLYLSNVNPFCELFVLEQF